MEIKTKPARNKQADSLPFVLKIVNGIEEKKGNEIVSLNLKKIANAPCDYFVICEGTSRTHVQAIAGSIEEYIKKETGNRPWHIEGLQNGEWVLLDYVDVVVHVFQPQIREHIALEDMWADAEVKEFSDKTPAQQPVIAAAEKEQIAPEKKAEPKIKTTVKVKSKKKVTAKVKAKPKVKTKAKAKVKVKVKAKTKTKAKVKTKAKSKVKAKVKSKSKKKS